ncbi:hypothetical protein MTBBW1_1560002 [Desulfamplus magnetovallimortis]|uniref:Uncharacterized protein n=1 Tax=Desulfamplus magnetovallimortis TaxID=1246637 RepID=A0A1W1H8L9_9BACT|nr:hypothetical protein MTBBW1_1560002 [Desulfamplus magnetovallimortis]
MDSKEVKKVEDSVKDTAKKSLMQQKNVGTKMQQ